ncbi:thiosulfate dehydrogenase [Chitinophaga niastensis]|uniref:Thiosulfate dehydrogenase n=1 Tax=Chitinophaga niastensis TaxID=536980 RepID=A0A2P8HSC2_CHINA|nr:c-type cytochrome [Chitinophaga niastensis]PSL49130.1 thiosulfate dehydrogenase [Chitinophaga niastensis]
MEHNDRKTQHYKRTIFKLFACLFMLVMLIGFETFFVCCHTLWRQPGNTNRQPVTSISTAITPLWQPPAVTTIPAGEKGTAILYGQALIAATARYLGPKGSVLHISNGMNCQNCHLRAGTKPFGNNYSLVAASYPKFRARSNSSESLNKRISDCFERSLNGIAPDSTSKEMMAIKAYIEWLGSEVKKGEQPEGAGIKKVALLSRPADMDKGHKVYTQQCQSCHGASGEGVLHTDGTVYTYPPLWGPNSYNDAAGLYRLSNFAGYVKYNMPFGVDYDSPKLTDEEAWDVAAFINSQPRPHKDQSADWHDIKQKPADFPFGPYADNFSENQHKYGPYKTMQP